MRRARLIARIVAMVAALLIAVPAHLLWRLVRLPSPWPRLLLGTIGRIVGLRVRTVGRPVAPVVFVANHQSWTDILLIAGVTGSTFVAKDEMRRVPLVGWLCTLNHTLFVRREDRLGVAEQIAAIRRAIVDGWSVTLFPEGTTGDGRTLLPFKATLLAVLDQPPPGVQVQPIRIDYGAATGEVAWVGEESGQSHALRLLGRRGRIPATLHFLEPFGAEGGRKAIAAEARRRILATGLRNGDRSQT